MTPNPLHAKERAKHLQAVRRADAKYLLWLRSLTDEVEKTPAARGVKGLAEALMTDVWAFPWKQPVETLPLLARGGSTIDLVARPSDDNGQVSVELVRHQRGKSIERYAVDSAPELALQLARYVDHDLLDTSTTVARLNAVNALADIAGKPVRVTKSDWHTHQGVRGFSIRRTLAKFASRLAFNMRIPETREILGSKPHIVGTGRLAVAYEGARSNGHWLIGRIRSFEDRSWEDEPSIVESATEIDRAVLEFWRRDPKLQLHMFAHDDLGSLIDTGLSDLSTTSAFH